MSRTLNLKREPGSIDTRPTEPAPVIASRGTQSDIMVKAPVLRPNGSDAAESCQIV